MSAAVNSVKSFEFAKIDGVLAQEAKDNAISSHDSIQVDKPDQYLKDEISLDWDPNETDINGAVDNVTTSTNNTVDNISGTSGAVANVTTGTVDTIPLEDIPIIILEQSSQGRNGVIRKKNAQECRICHKTFEDAQILQEHLTQCKIIGCPLCNFRTFENSAFRNHWISHEEDLNKHKPKPFLTFTEVKEIAPQNLDCPNCHKKYKTKNHLYLHLFKCEKLRCMHCDFVTFKTYELKRHFNNVHLKPDERTKTCPRCKKILKNRHSLSTHLWICGKKPRCECHDCGYKTFNKWNLRTHILAKHLQPKTEKNLSHKIHALEKTFEPQIIDTGHPFTEKSCSICNKIFNSQRALSAHTIHCKLYKCNHCLFETFGKAHLKKHMLRNHKLKVASPKSQLDLPSSSNQLDLADSSNQLDLPSSSCQLEDLQLDIPSTCTEQMCEICYEIFQNEETLRVHAMNCKEYQCTQCKYKTYIQADLTNHILQKHPQINGSSRKNGRVRQIGIDCPKCGNKYKNKQVVTAHLKFCGKEFLQCDYCSYKTKRPGVLKAHVASVHPSTLLLEDSIDDLADDEPTAACDKCLQKLKDHETMTFHSFYCPKKPYLNCNMCSFKSRYGLCLKNHVLRVHCQSILETYECPKCSGKLKTQETFKRHLFSCIPDTVLRCSLCAYMTRDPTCLSDHVIDKHYKNDPSDTSDTKLIPCPKCGNKVKSPQSLYSHLKNCEEPHR